MNSKIILWCIFFLLTNNLSAQKKYSKKSIDSILNTTKFHIVSNPKHSLTQFKIAYNASMESNYEVGISMSLIGMGHSIGRLENFKEALSCATKGRNIAKSINNDSLVLYANYLTAIYYGKTGLNIKAVDLIDDCFKRIDNLSDGSSKHYFKALLYTSKAGFSAGLKNKPSSNEFLFWHRKAFYHFSKVKQLISNPSFNNVGICFNELNQLDSAKFYFEKGLRFAKKKKLTAEIEYINLADVHIKLKDYQVAMRYLDSSIVISKQKKIYYLLAESHLLFDEIYSQLGNNDKAFFHHNNFLKYNDSAEVVERNRIVETVDYLITTEQDEKDSILTKHYKSIAFFILIIIIQALISLYLYRNRNFLKKESFEIVNQLQLKSSEINSLKQKVSSSYSEVIELAKKNDPLFISFFKELYPDFYKKLIDLQPNLTLTEQKVCFYIKLKFSSKEIADYTFVSIKAIQNRKNRLRKRLNICERDDIYKWFDNLCM